MESSKIFFDDYKPKGARAATVDGGTMLQAGKLRGRFPMVFWGFSIDIIFRSNYGPDIDSDSNRDEHQGCIRKGKGSYCIGLITLPPSCVDCLEIWEFQITGTHKTCPGLYRD